VDLFDAVRQDASGIPSASAASPLAVRMRPRSIDEVLGQDHLLADGSPLRRLIEDKSAASSIMLWGPPGTGKTTLAYLVAGNRRFVELSAVSAGVKDVRAIIDDSKRRVATGEPETVVFIDEVHRFTKTQQDVLLPAVENRWITLVAATTENPSFSVAPCSRGRSRTSAGSAAASRWRTTRGSTSCGSRVPTRARPSLSLRTSRRPRAAGER